MAEDSEPFVCCECIGEAFLSTEIEKAGVVSECGYCGEINPAITVEDLANKVEAAFETHFKRTPTEPNFFEELMAKDKESAFNWDRAGIPTADLLPDVVGISDEIAKDLHDVLRERHAELASDFVGLETEFDDDVHYAEALPDHSDWQLNWTRFVDRLARQVRFFDRDASQYLMRVFEGVAEQRTREGKPVVLPVGPELGIERLWRGRVFQASGPLMEALARPDKNLGPPPSAVAAAGRMNARGISLFYGATSQEIALAEVRPPVGSRVAMAVFDIVRPLNLLDLDAVARIRATGSVFDPSFPERLRQARFLRDLVDHFAAPVLPDDAELAYLPTQVVSDFLANWAEPRLDGLLYKSTQSNAEGRNVVLFHHAATVAPLGVPDEAEIEAEVQQMSDDGDFEYVVWETMTAKTGDRQDAVEGSGVPFRDGTPSTFEENYSPDPTYKSALRVDPEGVIVHDVKGVAITTNQYAVSRYSTTEMDRNEF